MSEERAQSQWAAESAGITIACSAIGLNGFFALLLLRSCEDGSSNGPERERSLSLSLRAAG